VPIVVWAIVSGQMRIAFILFVVAGVSDGIDGFLAKRFQMKSELGAYLDPLADKALIVSIYISLGIATAPYVWRAFEWAGERLGVPRLVWEMGFGLWWTIPALIAAAVVLMENLRLTNENDPSD